MVLPWRQLSSQQFPTSLDLFVFGNHPQSWAVWSSLTFHKLDWMQVPAKCLGSDLLSKGRTVPWTIILYLGPLISWQTAMCLSYEQILAKAPLCSAEAAWCSDKLPEQNPFLWKLNEKQEFVRQLEQLRNVQEFLSLGAQKWWGGSIRENTVKKEIIIRSQSRGEGDTR